MPATWKEFQFANHDEFLRLESLVRQNRKSFPKGWHCRFEGEVDIMVTNLSHDTLRRLARLDDIRLPEAMTLRPDDEIVVEVLAGG